MSSIQASPHPLVFPVTTIPSDFKPGNSEAIAIRTCARSLEGMQKEAVVSYGPTGKAWRMVCDEGPYLNGSDLAPFPLAFFCIGMVSSYMSEILSLLKQKDIPFNNIQLIQDNRYGMEGSAVQGTMTGSALPVELQLIIDSDDTPDDDTLRQIMADAVAASPVGALLKTITTSEFTITLNGNSISTNRVPTLEEPTPQAPEEFDALAPDASTEYPNDIIIKKQSADTVEGVAGGAGTSLSDNQKRILHMRGVCTLREDGVKQIQVELFKPIGSVFQFLSDDSKAFGGQERAPSGLAYLSAGLAFCYMTQLGRYAHIMKKSLDLYRIVQDTHFSLPGASGGTGVAATADVVKTHVYVNTDEGEEFTQTLIDMSEQTCFLHAACRANVKVKIRV